MVWLDIRGQTGTLVLRNSADASRPGFVGVVAIPKHTTTPLTLAIFHAQGNYQAMTLRPCPLVSRFAAGDPI